MVSFAMWFGESIFEKVFLLDFIDHKIEFGPLEAVSDSQKWHIRIPSQVAFDPFFLSFGKSLPIFCKSIHDQLYHQNIFYPLPIFRFLTPPN